MTTATVSLPAVTPAFQQAVREMGCQLGWKRVARMIAYGPTQTERVQVVHVQAPTRTRNQFGHKDNYGIPGPNPPRNKAGGFKCAAPGGYEREWDDLIGTGTFRRYSEGKRKPGAKPISVTVMQDKEEELRRKWASSQGG